MLTAPPPLVYMAESHDEKQIMLVAHGKTRALTSGKAWHLYPTITPDGSCVAYVEGTSETRLAIVVQDVKSGKRRQLVPASYGALHPRFAGDGHTLAFSGHPGGKALPQIGWLDTREATPQLHWLPSAHPAYFPALASCGCDVYYQGNLDGGHKAIFKRGLDGKDQPVAVTPLDGIAMSPSLSADDRYLAYTSKAGENWDVYVRDLVSKDVRRMTTDPAHDFAPSFRPDGSLVFASDRTGEFQLFQLAAGTTAAKPLVQGAAALYAPRSAGWTKIRQSLGPALPAPARSSFGAVRVGRDLYVVGGHAGHEHTYPPESFLDRVERLDGKTGRWVEVAPRPAKAHGLQVASFGGYLYAFGGFAYDAHHTPHWTSLDQIDRYDPVCNVWKTIGRLPHRRSSHVAAQVGSKVYMIGGWDSTPRKAHDADGRFHREIDVFDLATERSSTLTGVGLPNPLRRAFSGWVVGGKVILAGGIGEGADHFHLLDQVTVFDPARRRFAELPRLPFPTFAPALGDQKGSLYLFGGMLGIGKDYYYVNHIYELPLTSGDGWRHTGRYLHESKGFPQVVREADGGLAILGGHTYLQDGTDTPVPTLERFRVSE